MGAEANTPAGPDLGTGIPLSALAARVPLAGHVDGEAVLLYRDEVGIHAVGGACTHYGGPLIDGVSRDGVIRCPWHHACFSLRTGEALAAPALDPLPRWSVEIADDRVRVLGRAQQPAAARSSLGPGPESVVVVGAGAAGCAAVEALRREGYGGRIVLVDPDAAAPYDRPNLSKDYLAGSAPEEWLPLRPAGRLEELGIERRVDVVVSLDARSRELELSTGERLRFGALLLATGARPVRPRLPGVEQGHVHVLRSLEDCRALVRGASVARQVVVVGASFIGLEAAAALRTRGLEVAVVAPERVPFERTLGGELGRHLQSVHEAHGVAFHLGRTLGAVGVRDVMLDDGTVLSADLVLLGVGVRPYVELAANAGLEAGSGVAVDEYLETAIPGVYAAGDIASYPDPRTGRRVRVEHWVAAERQGQAAARNILGARERHTAVPFFWTQQYDVSIRYVGHAPDWTDSAVSGSPESGDCAVRYRVDGSVHAVATIGRDRECLEEELRLEREAQRSAEARHVG